MSQNDQKNDKKQNTSAGPGQGVGGPPGGPPGGPLDGPIQLLPIEAKIFGTVLAATRNSNVCVRVAGGWVRDKLLKKESDDIDFALDTITGQQFGNLVQSYLQSTGHVAKKVAVIKSNPDQSKHLETVTFRILGVDIDANNLRSEVYTGDSRIPEVQRATAQEDAMRRDFTINALFYDIKSHRVEDLTGRGLDDLQRGLLRTPLPPLKTFHDDPLRILRAARFAGRFGYALDPAIAAAAADPEVQCHLASKVSRERYGIEVKKMLSVADPRKAAHSFQLLCDWKLRPLIFQLPAGAQLDPQIPRSVLHDYFEDLEAKQEAKEEQSKDNEALTTLSATLLAAAACKLQTTGCAELGRAEAPAFLLAAFLLPMYALRNDKIGKKSTSAIFHIVRFSLRLPAALADFTSHLSLSCMAFLRLARQLETAARDQDAEASSAVQLEVGHILKTLKEKWVIALHLAEVAVATLPALGTTPAQLAAFQRWLEADSLLLGDVPCWTKKPMLNGKDLGKMFALKGPRLGILMKAQTDFMLLKPAGDQEALVAALGVTMASIKPGDTGPDRYNDPRN